jgi:hypothetical protein
MGNNALDNPTGRKIPPAEKKNESPEPENDTPVTDLVPQKKTELQLKAEQAVEMANKGEVNAFFAVYLTLASMNQALKDIGGRPPRWVRIGRVGGKSVDEGWDQRPIGKVVDGLTGVFLDAMGYFTELTLRAFDLFKDIDGAKALVEVGAEMLETICSDNMVKSIAYSVGAETPPPEGQTGETSFDNPLQSVVGPVRAAKNVLRYVPGYEDVLCVGRELFNLMKIDQREKVDVVDDKYEVHVNWETSGKLRLISWARDKPIPIFAGQTPFYTFTQLPGITYLGRRLIGDVSKPDNKDVRLTVTWPSKYESTRSESWNVYELDHSKPDILESDMGEIDTMLTALQYTGAKKDLKKRLMQFQINNKLDEDGGSIKGALDMHTIHRLLNMDYKNQNLKRAIGAKS